MLQADIVGRGGIPNIVDGHLAGSGDPPVEAQKGISVAMDLREAGQQPEKDPGDPLSRPGQMGISPGRVDLGRLQFLVRGPGPGDFGAADEAG